MTLQIKMATEIVHNVDICGGKACLKGTRIRVIDIVERYRFLHEQPEEVAAAFDLPVEAVFAALSYYYAHMPEIREEIEKDKELVQKLRTEMQPTAYAT